MRIDFHTHVFPDSLAPKAVARLSKTGNVTPYTDGTAAGLKAAMAAAGLDLAVVLPVVTDPRHHETINRTALAINQAEEGLLSFGGVHPDSPDWPNTLRWLKANGFQGIKLHPVYQGVPVDDPRTLRLLEAAYGLGLLVVLHAGYDVSMPGSDEASAARLCHLVQLLPPQGLILAHMGAWGDWQRAEALLGTTGLYLDTSFCLATGAHERLAPADFVRMVRRHGADRVLFGSDNPWSYEAESARQVAETGLTADELRLIMGENAARLLGLKDAQA